MDNVIHINSDSLANLYIIYMWVCQQKFKINFIINIIFLTL